MSIQSIGTSNGIETCPSLTASESIDRAGIGAVWQRRCRTAAVTGLALTASQHRKAPARCGDGRCRTAATSLTQTEPSSKINTTYGSTGCSSIDRQRYRNVSQRMATTGNGIGVVRNGIGSAAVTRPTQKQPLEQANTSITFGSCGCSCGSCSSRSGSCGCCRLLPRSRDKGRHTTGCRSTRSVVGRGSVRVRRTHIGREKKCRMSKCKRQRISMPTSSKSGAICYLAG